MLPPDSIIKASVRWLELLRGTSIKEAWGVIMSHSEYLDLTHTQYAIAVEWLAELDLVDAYSTQAERFQVKVKDSALRVLLFERAIEHARLPWLVDADLMLADGDLPADAMALAGVLSLNDAEVEISVRRVHGRIDLERRRDIGRAGETALVEYLERHFPSSTRHVAAEHDGFGYDIEFFLNDRQWNLEVKTTSLRGRLEIHLSRHEYETAKIDQNWQLVAVGLNDDGSIGALATVNRSALFDRAPQDRFREASWSSVRHLLSQRDLAPGLSFALAESGSTQSTLERTILQAYSETRKQVFAWMPSLS